MRLTPEQEQTLLRTLEKMKSLIYSEECKKIVKDVTGRDIIIFIGNTRAGKSTIVNHIIGNKLKAVKLELKKNKFIIVKQNLTDNGPVIGSQATSETTIPSAWSSSKIRGLIVDAPGFDDNRGEAQDVANAFYIKEMIYNANSVKFVLITDINDILGDNIGQFIRFVDKIHTILPNCDSMLDGMIVVFNKDKEETTKGEMIDCLTTKIINQDKIQIKSRTLVQNLIQHPNQFVICKTPTLEDQDCEKLFADINNAIVNEAQVLPKYKLNNIIPGISDTSKIFLLEARNHFTELKELDDILVRVETEFVKKIIPFDIENKKIDVNEMNKLKKGTIDAEIVLESLLISQATAKESLFIIGKYLPNVVELKEGGNIYMKFDFLTFVDGILNLEDTNIFQVKVNMAISRMKYKILQFRIQLQEKMFEITTEEATQMCKQLTEQHKSSQKTFQEEIAELKKKQAELLEKLNSQSSCVIL